ncbi:MAG: ABC transporter permease subunit [Methanoregula sp.]|uniref:ABC transporter permease subunit n=1 Tax=Methanoregula sp. TaxID=2052170 RepID=UPI003BAF2072
MRFSKAWIIASKDIDIFRKKKSIFYSVILLPLFVSVGLPLMIFFLSAGSGSSISDVQSGLPPVINAFSFVFLIGAASLPTVIASYSIVGEKQEQSLEPLLATPTTDSEILLGKSIGALLPPLVAIWIGGVIFMCMIDAVTSGLLGYVYYPNGMIAVIMLLLVPLAAITAVEVSVIFSARINDVRTAQQLGSLIVIPFAVIYLLGEINVYPLTIPYLLIISVIILVADVGLFSLAVSTFRRDEILTKWK